MDERKFVAAVLILAISVSGCGCGIGSVQVDECGEQVEQDVVDVGSFEFSEELRFGLQSGDKGGDVDKKSGCKAGAVKDGVDRVHASSGQIAGGALGKSSGRPSVRGDFARVDLKLEAGCEAPEGQLYLRSGGDSHLFLCRVRNCYDPAGWASKFFLKGDFASDLFSLYLGDMALSLSGGLVSSADIFLSVWDRDFPFSRAPCISPCTYVSGVGVRGIAARIRSGSFEGTVVKGDIGRFSCGESGACDAFGCILGAARSGPWDVMISVTGNGETFCKVLSLGATYKGESARFALSAAAMDKSKVCGEIRLRVGPHPSSVSLMIVEKPYGYSFPLGKVLGRRHSAGAVQRGAMFVMRKRMGRGFENVAGFERYYRCDRRRYIRTRFFERISMRLDHARIVLTCSGSRSLSVDETPVPPFPEREYRGKSEVAISTYLNLLKGTSSNLRVVFSSYAAGEGFLMGFGVSRAVAGGRLKFYYKLVRPIPLRGNPGFYYRTSYFPGNYPWRYISGKLLAQSISCTLRMSRVRVSAFFESGDSGPTGMFQVLFIL